jgi:hypothetical protein
MIDTSDAHEQDKAEITMRSSTVPADTKSVAAKATARAREIAEPETRVGPPLTPDYSRYRVEPPGRVRLSEVNPDETEHYRSGKDVADELAEQRKRIRRLQERLYAEHGQSLLIVLQALDTGGKDGTIRGVFEGVNPQGCQVWSFKAPSSHELEQDFLWAIMRRFPRWE